MLSLLQITVVSIEKLQGKRKRADPVACRADRADDLSRRL